jgi:hypothetical protein
VEVYEDTEISVIIYNLEGQEILKLYKGKISAGVHSFSFDGGELPSGIYIYKITTPGYTQSKKMILAK